MTTQELILLDLRLRYRFSEPFSEERDQLWSAIQNAERGMDPDIVRAIIERVIFTPDPEDEQMELPLAA